MGSGEAGRVGAVRSYVPPRSAGGGAGAPSFQAGSDATGFQEGKGPGLLCRGWVGGARLAARIQPRGCSVSPGSGKLPPRAWLGAGRLFLPWIWQED